MKKNVSRPSSPRTDRTQPAAARKSPSPHGHPLTRLKPEDRAHPAERKAEQKRRPQDPD